MKNSKFNPNDIIQHKTVIDEIGIILEIKENKMKFQPGTMIIAKLTAKQVGMIIDYNDVNYRVMWYAHTQENYTRKYLLQYYKGNYYGATILSLDFIEKTISPFPVRNSQNTTKFRKK